MRNIYYADVCNLNDDANVILNNITKNVNNVSYYEGKIIQNDNYKESPRYPILDLDEDQGYYQ